MDYLTLTLQGDHYSQGRQHGRQVRGLRPQIAQAIADQVRREARFAQSERDGADAQFERLLRETRELLQEIDVPLLDLIRGQAEALEFEFDTLLRFGLATYLRDDLVIRKLQGASVLQSSDPVDVPHGVGEPGSEGCTTWAACGLASAHRSGSAHKSGSAHRSHSGGHGSAFGQPILVKSRDQTPEFLPLQIVAQVTPQSGYRYVCSGSAGCPGIFCAGINEAGLAVADSHVTSTDLGPGLPDYSLMMHLLEDHDNVSSALDYLRSVPRMGRNNLILADAQGHLAVFEIGHRGYGLSETNDGVLVSTNHFVTPALRHCFVDTQAPPLRGSSFHRYQTVVRALEGAMGRVDVPFAQRLMATHAGLLDSLCRHPSEYSKVSTISGSIFLPAQRAMLFCNGLPCQGRYDEYVL